MDALEDVIIKSEAPKEKSEEVEEKTIMTATLLITKSQIGRAHV